jgi:multicomponent K+:H+ antiporter subunit D
VAALFAIMTKVGAYAILRMYTLVFGPEVPALGGGFGDWVLIAAVITLIIGMVGVLGAARLERLAAFAVIGSMGMLLIAVSLFTPDATSAALYYTVHSTFAGAALFLVADLVGERRGESGGRLQAAPPIPQNGLIAAMFFAAGIAMTGLPPLSGFLGKLLILDAAREAGQAALVWTAVLATSLLAVVGFARAGSTIFWKSWADHDEAPVPAPRSARMPFVAAGGVVSALVLLTVFAGPAGDYFAATSAQLYAPSAYIDAVMGAR